MPINTFDASEMKQNLNSYIAEINDLATSPEFVDKYAGFITAVYDLQALTNSYYTPAPDGSYPLLDTKSLQNVKKGYMNAMKQARAVIYSGETGAVGEKMKHIAEELLPMMSVDYTALEFVNVEKEPVTLPELIAKSRSQAVDLGEQASVTVSGQANARQHIKVKNGNTIEEGYFTPTQNLNFSTYPYELMDSLEHKYGPNYKPILDKLREKTPEQLVGRNWVFYRGLGNAENMTPEQIKTELLDNVHSYEFEDLGVTERIRSKAEKDPKYLNFLEELTSGMRKHAIDYQCFKEGGRLRLKDGANIDKRNIGLFRVAKMIGHEDLVAESKPMIVIQNGKPVSGTFMKHSEGVCVHEAKNGDAILKYNRANLCNPRVYPKIAAMQVIDFICGNVDRNPGNMLFIFDKPGKKDALIQDIKMIDNDLAFGNAHKFTRLPNDGVFILPKDMKVIPESTYNAMKVMDRDTFRLELADCGLSKEEIDHAWERKTDLQNKIEMDKGFFQDKPKGQLQAEKIRIIPDEDWELYRIDDLKKAKINPADEFVDNPNQFNVLVAAPHLAKQKLPQNDDVRKYKEWSKAAHDKVFGADPPAEVPIGIVVGNGLAQEADPLNAEREDTVKLVIPNMANVVPVGGNLNKRYPLSYKDGNGQEKQVFATLPNELSAAAVVGKVIDNAISQNSKYKKQLTDIKNYYVYKEATASFEEMLSFPTVTSQLPYEKLGWSKEEFDRLCADNNFTDAMTSLSGSILSEASKGIGFNTFGFALGQRMELGNVAMSEISELLGAGGLIAKSRVAKIMCDSNITDAVIMDKAKGYDISQQELGSPMAKITAEQAKKTYNDPRGLKGLADLQALDYICLNKDRNSGNMNYSFEDIDTAEPKFIGIQGIDNDFTFGTGVTDLMPVPKVISESMAKKLDEPELMNSIADKMQKNGFNEGQINSARQRIEAFKAEIAAGRTKVVKDAEWGKGSCTLEELAKTEGSIFHTVKRDVVDTMAAKAAEWNSLPEQQRAAVEPEKIQYAQAVKVQDFGLSASEKAELNKLTKEAEKEFRANMEEKIAQSKQMTDLSGKDLVSTVKDSCENMDALLESADPFFSMTSGTYKELKKSVKQLKDLSKGMMKKMNDDSKLGQHAPLKLLNAIEKVQQKAAAYLSKKDREVKSGTPLTVNGGNRVEATKHVTKLTAKLRLEYMKTSTREAALRSPAAHLHARINRIQELTADHKGDALRTLVAQEIYFKGLGSSSVSTKNSDKLLDALNPEILTEGVNQIKQDPAFQRLSKLPDSELRMLAQDGDCSKLMNKYFQEAAKFKQESKVTQARQQKVTEAKNEIARNNAANK